MEKPDAASTQAAKAVALAVVVLAGHACPFLVVVVDLAGLAARRSSRAAAGCCGRPSRPSRRTSASSPAASSPTPSASARASPSSAPLLSLACTVMLAYGLSRPGVFGGKPVLLLVLFTSSSRPA